jgi:hypothetical protein
MSLLHELYRSSFQSKVEDKDRTRQGDIVLRPQASLYSCLIYCENQTITDARSPLALVSRAAQRDGAGG